MVVVARDGVLPDMRTTPLERGRIVATSLRLSPGMRRLALLLIATVLTVGPARSEEAKARLGRVMWSAFECVTFASMAGEQEAAKRLFDIGLKAGRDFIEALNRGDISQEEFNKIVPMGVTMLMREGGPSTDFVVGRVYSYAQEDAYDAVVKHDASGLPLDTKDWIMDDGLKKMRAENSYSNSNCELIE
jgi:hypothetical protein